MNARSALVLTLLGSLLAGCATQRKITVSSDPPGARVWLNDVEIGRTPASAAFRFYGTYDVRVELEGYEPLHEVRKAEAPIWEYPGLDLVALAVPGRKHVSIDWHFALAPTLESSQPREAVEADLLGRARAMRERLAEGAAEPAPTPPAEAPPSPPQP